VANAETAEDVAVNEAVAVDSGAVAVVTASGPIRLARLDTVVTVKATVVRESTVHRAMTNKPVIVRAMASKGTPNSQLVLKAGMVMDSSKPMDRVIILNSKWPATTSQAGEAAINNNWCTICLL